MKSEKRDPLESRLDAALREYSSQEPRAGLEQRVLRRVFSAGPAPRSVFRRWVFVIPALACLLFVGGIFWPRRVPKTRTPEIAQAVVKTPAPLPFSPGKSEPARRPVRRRHPRYPRQERFPAPAPVTAEERALLAFVRRSPEEARQVLAESRLQSVEPIRIEKIEIQPLPNDGLN